MDRMKQKYGLKECVEQTKAQQLEVAWAVSEENHIRRY